MSFNVSDRRADEIADEKQNKKNDEAQQQMKLKWIRSN